MSDPLDDKLRAYYAAAHVAVPGYAVDEDEWIAQIRQAFSDAGYRFIDDVQYSAYIRAKDGLMTGPEFYLKFMDEVLHISDEDMDSRLALGRAYREAAKRAAGIADKPQGV